MANGAKSDSRISGLLQWRLRYVLGAFLFVAGLFGWLVRERSLIQSHRRALDAIGATVGFGSSQPNWHRRLFGPDPRYYVLGFQVGYHCDNQRLAQLKGLDHLESLILNKSQISDDGLIQLRELPRLKNLNLRDTAISDAGVDHLTVLRLAHIDVTGTRITEAGITRLRNAFPYSVVLPLP